VGRASWCRPQLHSLTVVRIDVAGARVGGPCRVARLFGGSAELGVPCCSRRWWRCSAQLMPFETAACSGRNLTSGAGPKGPTPTLAGSHMSKGETPTPSPTLLNICAPTRPIRKRKHQIDQSQWPSRRGVSAHLAANRNPPHRRIGHPLARRCSRDTEMLVRSHRLRSRQKPSWPANANMIRLIVPPG
jgi:hypothetical protein